MASLDKLIKSFEMLKIQMHNENVTVRKQEMRSIAKKEKILHLNLIHESLISPSVKQTNEFTKVLSHAIETFIIYFDDDDQDVYFVAEDCLNKTVKCLIETHVGRLKIEFYRFIRRNESEKCLKAALTRFAELCHLIRPQKSRQFAEFFIKENPMKKIALRQEESIQNILIGVMTKLCSSLCCCMMENEIKTFMDAFIPNLSNESPVNSYRRVAAVCLTLICLYSKNPFSSFHVLYEECFKLLFHNRAETATKYTIWGVLICFRNIIIHISELEKAKPNVESQRNSQPNTFNQQTVCEIYEICLLYLEHEDSSVVSASLECLQALMKHQPLNFGEILTANGSIKESLLKSKKLENSLQTQSSLSQSLSNSQLNAAAVAPPKLATILTAEDFKLNEFSTSLDTNLSISSESLNNLMPSSSAADRSTSDIDPNEIEDTLNSSMSNREVNFDFDQTAPTENEDFQDQNEASVEVPSESTDTPIDQNQASKDLNETIGAQFSDTEPPLTYLTRLLCHKYLLSGENGVLKPDKSVKVLVKALALDCISHAVSLMPNLVALSLSIDPSSEKTQYIHDVILYINHSDDKMKSNACNLIGSLIGAVLTQFDANYERWFNSLSEKSSILNIETLVNHLLNVIKNDPSNLSKKSAVSSLQLFLPTLLASKHSSLALSVILSILPLKNSPYNLVKCELVQLLALIDYKLVRYAENERQSQEISIDIQERVLREVFLYLLGSEDNKLRLETAKALTHLIDNLCYYDMRKEGSGTLLLVAHSKSLVSRLNLISQLNNNTIALSAKHLFSHLKSNSYLNNFTQPFHRYIQQHSMQKQLNSPIEHNLNYVLPLIIQLLVESTDKYLIVGCLEFIDYMLQVYDPAIYIDMALIQDLLSLLQALINHSLIAYDLYLHEILMKLLGNLYSTLVWKVLTSKYDTASITQQSIEMIQKLITKKDQPFYLLANNTLLINYANKFYSHCMRLLCIISCVIDESSLPSSVTSNLSAGSNYVSNITSIIPSKADEIIDAPATIPPSTTGSSNTQQSSSSNPSEKSKETSTKSSFYGSFQHSSFYMKIYEATKISYTSWKKSAHVGAYDKFTAFIKSTLSVFSQLLECALSANELARHLDEILLYLRIIFSIDAANSVKCVTQLLKALFGLNFTHLYLSNLVQSYNNTSSSVPKLSSMQNLAYLSSPNAPNSKSTLFTVLIKSQITSFNSFMHAQNSLFKSEQHQLSSLQASSTQAHSPNDDKNAANSLNASSSAPALSNTSTGSKLNPLNLFGMVRKKISSNADTSAPASNKSQSGQQKIDSKTTLAYIRSFEAIVIKSLKHYTVSSSNHLQIRILDLLIQLIHLKVNYSLLDSDKVFIEYVLRQFDYLEQRKCSLGGELSRSSAGDCYESAVLHDYEVDSLHSPTDTSTNLSRINQASHALTCKHNEHQRAHILIPKLFEFLIVISYEKPSNEASSRQSTTLINMPKLKQICDNLLASENSPHTHVIPALSQLVYNLFVNSRLNDLVNNPQTVHTIKDIELQRDVLLITLLKLCTYPQIWHLLTIVALKYKQEGNEEKWKRVSRQICDSIFAQIQTHSLNFYEFNGNETRAIRRFSPTYNPYLESVKYLIQLFTQLMPQVYRPIDFILTSLFKLISEFNPTTNNQNNTASLNQWLCLCITHIHILICNSSEDIILSRLQDLIPQMVGGSSGMQIDDHDLLSPAIYLAKYLMRIIDISFTHMQQPNNSNNNFLINSSLNFTYHLTYNLLNYVIFIVNCGFYKKLANSFRLITSEHQIVTTRLSNSYPLLGSLWQYFLLINGYEKCVYSLNDDESYEDEENDSLSSRAHLTLNQKLFKYATLTIFSEHVNSDTSGMDITQPLTMMLINYLGEIFELCNESSVIYLISSIHRNSSASSLFLHTINSFWKKLTKLSVLQTCLKTLEGLHLSVSGNLLKLLVEKYFNLPYVSLVRYADYIACQRVEMMISLPLDELSTQLNDDDTHRLIEFFSNEFRYAFRHQRLISLLKKLSKRFEGEAPGSDGCIDEKMERNDDCCEFLMFYSGDLDKEWFYNIVRSSCCVSQSANYHQVVSNSEILALKPKQCALMLSSLDYANLATILLSKDFKLSILAECVMLGGKKTQEIVQNLPLSLINSASEKEFAHPLWLAATNCLFEMLNYRCVSLPSEQLTPAMYQSKLNELLSEMDLNSYIHPLNEAINAYIKCVSQYSCLAQHNDEHQQDIITYLLFQFNLISHACAKQRLMVPHGQITESLHAIFNLLSNKVLLKLFIKRKHFITSISMIIRHFYELLFSYYLHQSDEIVLTKPQIDYSGDNQQSDSFQFTIETFEILQQLKCLLNSNKKIPLSLRDLVTKIYQSISRLPIIDQFMRIPNQLWAIYRVNYDALVKCDSPIPPIDYLKDSHVLKEYFRHIQSVGWSSRAQFENEYVSMLQLLTSLSKEAESDELPLEELKERNRCICLIIRALASWLVKSTLTPSSGTPLNSHYELASRNRSPTFLYSPFGKQYLNVRLACEKYSRYGTFERQASIIHASNEYIAQALDPTLIQLLYKSIRSEQKRGELPLGDDLVNSLLGKLAVNTNRQAYYLYAQNLDRALLVDSERFTFGQVNLEALLKFLACWNSANVNAIGAISAAEQQQLYSSSSLANKAISNLMKVAEYFSEDEKVGNGLQEVVSTPDALVPRSFSRAGLDMASVLRTIFDYFETFFNSPKSCLQLRYDLLKSYMYLANTIFDSKTQYEQLNAKIEANFEWINEFMSDSVNLSQMPVVNELIDDSLVALCVYSACLAKACLFSTSQTLSGKDFDRLNKLFDNCLKTNSLTIKIAAVNAIIYWLELISYGYLNNISNSGVNISEYSKQIVDHLCKEVNQLKVFSVFATTNTRYISVLWSAMFFAIENCLDCIKDAQNFLNGFFKQTTNMLNDPNTPYYLFYQLFLGLERLLLTNMVPQNELNLINRTFSSKQSDEQRNLCFNVLQLTILYSSNQVNKKTNYWNDLIQKATTPANINSNNNNSNNIIGNETISSSISTDNFDFLQPKVAQFYLSKEVLQQQSGYPQIIELQSEPELQAALLKVLEIVTGYFDKMKTSTTARESHMYASVLPQLLCDFLPPHDLLNKLITEFSNSSQHPYPESIAYVLYECFNLLQEKGLQSQIQEWCLLSISNFVQRSNINESIWLLSCFLISVSKNMWLKATFPFVLNRYGACETVDKAIFFMAVIEFTKQLQDKSQVSSIYKTFESVAKPGTPYIELVKILGNLQ